MKKIIIYSLLCIILIVCLSSQDDAIAVVFPGTGSIYKLNPTDENSKNTNTVPMEESLFDAYKIYTEDPAVAYENLVLIGHSQGGMRALGYATLMADNGLAAKGVISVGGPVRGYTPLTGGKEVMVKRIAGVVDDIIAGIDAVVNTRLGLLIPWLNWFSLCHEAAIPLLAYVITGDDKENRVSNNNLLRLFLAGRLPGDTEGRNIFGLSYDLIEDLTPGSEYVNKYCMPPEVVDVKAHVVRMKLAAFVKEYKVNIKDLLGNPEAYPVVKVDIKKKYVYVHVPATYKPDPHLYNTTNIAYIRGTNSDLYNFMRDTDIESEVVEDVKETCDLVANVMCDAVNTNRAYAAADTAAALAAYAALNVPLGAFFTAKALADGNHADNARKAANMFHDINNTVNKRIYNTIASDGFVPVAATTLPLSVTGGRGWQLANKADILDFPVSHNGLKESDAIWGAGGSYESINRGGRIDEWLMLAGIDEAIIDDWHQDVFDTGSNIIP